MRSFPRLVGYASDAKFPPPVLLSRIHIPGASGATDVLSQASIHTSLEEALAGTNVVCGTGMPFDMHRKRRLLLESDETRYVEPRIFFDRLMTQSKNFKEGKEDEMIRLALVFGGERRGTQYLL